MRFSNSMLGVSLLLATSCVYSQQDIEQVLEDTDTLMKQKSFLHAVRNPEAMKQGSIEGLGENRPSLEKALPKGYEKQAQLIKQRSESMLKRKTQELVDSGEAEQYSEEYLAKKMRQHENATKLIAQESQVGVVSALKNQIGLEDGLADAFGQGMTTEPDIIKAIFISFSMSERDIREAMKVAANTGAQLFLNGMHPNHTGIQDTIRLLQRIGAKLDIKPDVRFKPRYFEQYDVKAVPTLIYKTPDKTLIADGLLNIQWLETKSNTSKVTGDIGNFGPVTEVLEESIIETFRKRMAGYDWSGKKEAAIDGFWKKQQFETLPRAAKSESWFIDPTVKVTKDITTPDGQQLAKAGQIINPLAQEHTPLTMYVFDPTDIKQLEWVDTAIKRDDTSTQVMVMFSQLNKKDGWKHLEALRAHLNRELYQLPNELVKKFDLSGLPAKISTISSKRVFKIEQVMIEG